jgi:hypothetical protein
VKYYKNKGSGRTRVHGLRNTFTSSGFQTTTVYKLYDSVSSRLFIDKSSEEEEEEEEEEESEDSPLQVIF